MKSYNEQKDVAQWEPLDPTFLIQCLDEAVAARNMEFTSAEEIEWLRASLKEIDKALIVEAGDLSSVCYYFVRASKPNEPGSDWQFAKNINVYGWAEIHFDVLKDGRLGGAEVWSLDFYHRLPRSRF